MNKILVLVIAVFAALPAVANRFEQRACSCFELDRRVQGLEYVLRYARLDHLESRRIRNDVSAGKSTLRQSQYLNGERQEQACSLGNQDVDQSWVRWQSWIARNGADIGNRCY